MMTAQERYDRIERILRDETLSDAEALRLLDALADPRILRPAAGGDDDVADAPAPRDW